MALTPSRDLSCKGNRHCLKCYDLATSSPYGRSCRPRTLPGATASAVPAAKSTEAPEQSAAATTCVPSVLSSQRLCCTADTRGAHRICSWPSYPSCLAVLIPQTGHLAVFALQAGSATGAIAPFTTGPTPRSIPCSKLSVCNCRSMAAAPHLDMGSSLHQERPCLRSCHSS